MSRSSDQPQRPPTSSIMGSASPVGAPRRIATSTATNSYYRPPRRRPPKYHYITLIIGLVSIVFVLFLVYQFLNYILTKNQIKLFVDFISRGDILNAFFIFLGIIAVLIVAFIAIDRGLFSSILYPYRSSGWHRKYGEGLLVPPPVRPARRLSPPPPARRLPLPPPVYDYEYDDLYEDVYRVRSYSETSTNRIEKIISDKAQKFLNIPNISFQFANHEQIKSFYDEYFKEPTIESLVSEITGETSGDIKGSLPKIIEAEIGGKDINKWISNIKIPESSSNAMFLRYQRETIKKEQVTLGIEEVDIELTELEAFEDSIENIKERFDLDIDEAILNNQRTYLKEKAAEKTLHKLEQATGWVLIEGKFKVEREENFYRCTYVHPVNNYLSGQIGPVTISVLISMKSLEEHIKGNYAQSVGRSIPLKIYGQVWQPIDRETDVWDLQLTPLAIY
jgi:hypothetical protein